MSMNERLGRLLFIVPYVAQRDGVPLRELADKLGVTPKQIEADLDLLCMVGQPPLTPDHLIDIYVEDDVVYVELDQSLSRPPPLTHEEARALVLGAKLVGEQGGLGQELEHVLDKIVALLNPVDQEAVRTLAKRISVWQDAPSHPQAVLRGAIGRSHEVELEYYSVSSDRVKNYRLQPLALITHSGVAYLVALDIDAEHHEKLFRLDRMGTVSATQKQFVPPDEIDLEKFRTSKLYFGTTDDFTAEVHFAPAVATRAAEYFAKKDCKWRKDGSVVVRVSTSSPAWLARWVLPFGLDAEVLGPPQSRKALAELCNEAVAAYARK